MNIRADYSKQKTTFLDKTNSVTTDILLPKMRRGSLESTMKKSPILTSNKILTNFQRGPRNLEKAPLVV